MDAAAADDYGRSYHAATAVAAPERPALSIDLDVDVCVIGAGLAGLTTALEVARLGWSVVVLEAKRVAWSASGRNCGFVLPGFACDPRTIVARVGLDRARQLWSLSEAGVAYVRTIIRERELPGVQPARGWLDVSKTDDLDDMDDTLALLMGEFGAAVEGWPVEQVREHLRTDAYFHAIHYPNAFHIQPLNYALGLAAAAEAAGVRIFEGTPAREIDPAGVRKRVATPGGMVRAGHVVLAGNVHMGEIMPQLAATVLSITSTTAVTAPLGPRLREAIAYPGAVSDSRFANHHYRVIDGDRLLWCGEGTCFPRDPMKVAQRAFAPAIASVYPGLGPVEFTHAWNGSMAFAIHRMPQIGEISPGLWVAGAFAGHGLNTTAIAGNLIARAIVENDDTVRQFEPWDLVWAGGTAGRVLQEARSRLRNRREAIEAGLARSRDRKRQAGALPRYRQDDDPADPPPPAAWAEVRAVATAPSPVGAGEAADDRYEADGYAADRYDTRPVAAYGGRSFADPSFGPADPPEPPNTLDWRRARAIEEGEASAAPDRPAVGSRSGRSGGR